MNVLFSARNRAIILIDSFTSLFRLNKNLFDFLDRALPGLP